MKTNKDVELWNVKMIKELGQDNIILGIKQLGQGIEELDVGVFTHVFHMVRFQHWNDFIQDGSGLVYNK